jgi:hypothetical protein
MRRPLGDHEGISWLPGPDVMTRRSRPSGLAVADLHVAVGLDELEGDAPAVGPPVREASGPPREARHLRAVRQSPQQRRSPPEARGVTGVR